MATEHKVALGTDPGQTRVLARRQCRTRTWQLSNYRANLTRQGSTEDDLDNGGSDQLIDALVAQGDAAAVRQAARTPGRRCRPTSGARGPDA